MKHFLFTIKVTSQSRSGITYKRVSLWRVQRNKPVYLGSYDYHSEADSQAALSAVKKYKALPARYFKDDACRGREYGAMSLFNDGIAEFHQL